MKRRSLPLLAAALFCSVMQALLHPVLLPAGATVPGKNGPVIFQSQRDGNWELYVRVPGQSGAFNMTQSPAEDQMPAYDPLGKRIAFTSNRSGQYEIYVFGIVTPEKLVQVTSTPGKDIEPAWAPDGSKLVFASDRDGDSDLYVQQVDTAGAPVGEPVNITNNTAEDHFPSWTADGTRLAWSSNLQTSDNVNGDEEIFTVNVNANGIPTGAPLNVTKNDATDKEPNWSPSGHLLAYQSDADGDMDIYVSNADGSNPSMRTQNDVPDRSPAWSPDGTMLVFAHKGLSIATLDYQSTAPPVIADSSDSPQGFPDWSVVPACRNAVSVTSTKLSGTFVTHSVRTAYPAKGLQVTMTATGNPAAKYTAAPVANPPATTWDVKIAGLTPGTSYDTTVAGVGICTGMYKAAGPQKTKRRQVTLTFKKLSMLDDSDDLSCAEMVRLAMKLGSEYTDLASGEVMICTDEVWDPTDVKLTIPNATGKTIEIGVAGMDDDIVCFPICLLQSAGIKGMEWDDPPGDGGDDYEAAKFLETRNLITPNDAPSVVEFKRHVFSDQELEFDAYVRFAIIYV